MPIVNKYVYTILCANGHVDMLLEDTYTNTKNVTVDDKLWGEDSGWAMLICDTCGHVHEERVYTGMTIECPLCNTIEVIPQDAELLRSHLDE